MPALDRPSDISKRGTANQVPVWDILVRAGHWSMVTLFFIAYFTEDDLLTLHSWAGYGVGAYVVVRIVWGLIGSRYARFSDFLYGPKTAVLYLANLISFHAKRYVGHSPAGAMMVFALLIALTVTTGTGIALLAVRENAGPLAPWLGQQASVTDTSRTAASSLSASGAPAAGERREANVRRGRRRPGRWLREVHELAANLTLILIILHVAGVALASLAHRENLIRAMITGRKRAE